MKKGDEECIWLFTYQAEMAENFILIQVCDLFANTKSGWIIMRWYELLMLSWLNRSMSEIGVKILLSTHQKKIPHQRSTQIFWHTGSTCSQKPAKMVLVGTVLRVTELPNGGGDS